MHYSHLVTGAHSFARFLLGVIRHNVHPLQPHEVRHGAYSSTCLQSSTCANPLSSGGARATPPYIPLLSINMVPAGTLIPT